MFRPSCRLLALVVSSRVKTGTGLVQVAKAGQSKLGSAVFQTNRPHTQHVAETSRDETAARVETTTDENSNNSTRHPQPVPRDTRPETPQRINRTKETVEKAVASWSHTAFSTNDHTPLRLAPQRNGEDRRDTAHVAPCGRSWGAVGPA